MKYFLYARKSSESEDRQVQSIEDQVNRLTEFANTLGLQIVRVFREAKSAKSPNNRPLFAEMLSELEKGKAAGILCWQINRLSRNPIDSATVQWMLQEGTLQSIRTPDREYRPEDNVLLFSVESGMANQFILDLRKNTLRGMDSKLAKGWVPALARLGYLNDVLTKTVIKDPERFDLVRQMWNLMLTGNYSMRQILNIATKDWGFTTVQRKNKGGTPLSYSGIYSMFKSKFYAGIIEWNGKEYAGVHEPMITLEEYERVQVLLGRGVTRPRPRVFEHPFTGLIICGECGAHITAETKYKDIKSTGERKRYDYYHCTHKRKYIECSQRRVVSEENLSEQIEKEVLSITILPEFREWALEVLNEWNDTEITQRTQIHTAHAKNSLDIQAQIDSLTKMRYRELIGDEEFVRERDSLQTQLAHAKQHLRETESRAENWLALTEQVFDFACYAYTKFTTGTIQEKKEILAALGSKFTMKDSLLTIELNPWFVPVLTRYPELEKAYSRSEPTKVSVNKERTDELTSVRSLWGA